MKKKLVRVLIAGFMMASFSGLNLNSAFAQSQVLTWSTWLDGKENHFKEPYSVTVDPNGSSIYVLVRQVQKRNLDGSLVWGKDFSGARDAAFDKEGNLYVVDTGLAEIKKMSPDGTWMTVGSWNDGFRRPGWITIDSRGNLYVSDSEHKNVQKWNTDDGTWSVWLSDFLDPCGLATDSQDHIYIVDSEQNQIQKRSADGSLLDTWTTGSEPFYHPVDLTIDKEDNVYVSEAEKNRIQMRKTDGSWIILGTDFLYPFGMDVDNHHNIYVADIGNSRIQKANLDGILSPAVEAKPEPKPTGKLVKLTVNNKDMTITANGTSVMKSIDTPPSIVNNFTMIPLRGVLEELGASLDYVADQNKVVVTKGDTKVELVIGSNQAVVNGNTVTLDQPAMISNARTLVPLRFVSESLGYTVSWDGSTKSISIQ